MIDISVIVPVYNVENYIRKCVDSIIAQSLSNIEIILVDDGSTDSSGSICEQYAEQDCRVVVVHKKNGGLSSARNAGINIAKGKYIGFVDSDDAISDDMYETLYNNIEKESADISICGIYQCFEGKKPRENEYWYRVLDAENAIAIAFKGKIFSVNAVNKLYKRELFETIRYPEGKASEDAFVIVDLFNLCNRIVATSEQKYFYFHRQGSITTVKSASNCFDCIEAYSHNMEVISDKYPTLRDVAQSRLCWANFYALDRLIIANDENEYINEEREIIRFIKKNTGFIIFKSSLALSRKVSTIALYIGKSLYKKLMLGNVYMNKRVFS